MHERRARLQPGADWLRAQRVQRGWSQRELAEKITEAGFPVKQDRISVYENGQDEPRPESRLQYARGLAAVFKISETEVFLGLEWPLPGDLEDDEAIFRRQLKKHGREFFLRILGEDYPLPEDDPLGRQGQARVRRNPLTRKSEPRGRSDQDRASGA